MHRRILERALLALASLALLTPASLALGPVDVEVGAAYWDSDVELDTSSGSRSESGAAPGFQGQIWIGNIGFKAHWWQVDLDGGDFGYVSDFQAIDFRWKVIEPLENVYLAIGAGLQQLDFDLGTIPSDESLGGRISAEGRFGLGWLLFGYGEAAYFIGLDDIDVGDGNQGESLGGYEYEFGVAIKPAPFLRLRVGYRFARVDFDVTGGGGSVTLDTDGYVAGLSVNF